jgi:hypothetical protein
MRVSGVLRHRSTFPELSLLAFSIAMLMPLLLNIKTSLINRNAAVGRSLSQREFQLWPSSQRRADFVREDFLLCHEGSVHASNSRIASLAVYAFIFRYSLSEENQ